MTRIVLSLILLLTAVGPYGQAQGLGNGRDLRLTTSLDALAPTEGGKIYGTGQLLTVNLTSPGSTLNAAPAFVVLDLRPRTDNNVIDLPNEPGAIGVGFNFLFFMDGSISNPAVFPGPYTVPASVGIPIPDLTPLGPISLYFQGFTFDGMAPNGLAFTKTVRHDTTVCPSSGFLSNTSYNNGTIYGYAVTVADINADGFDDVLTGAIGADPSNVASAGEIRIEYGPTLTTNLTLVAPVLQANAQFGGLIRVGDVTGDNVVDIIVGARFEDVGSAIDTGRVYVMEGPSFTTVTSVTAPALVFGIRFGAGLTLADWNNDGIKDLCVGAPRANSTSNVIQAGQVYIFQSPAMTLIATLDIPAAATGDKFGDALIGHDFNGDNLDDLFVGAPGRESGTADDAGGAYCFLNGSLTPAIIITQPADDFAELGNGFNAADINGDGAVDLVAGTEFADGPVVDCGQVQIIWGPTFTVRNYLEAPAPSMVGGFGSATSVGDVNRDGFIDIVVGELFADIGAETNAGRAWILLGPTFEQSKLLEPFDPAAGANYGRRVAIGDLNNDGFDDVIVGAPLADPLGPVNNQEGAVYFYY